MARYEGLLAETVTITGFKGDDVESYFARPLGPGPFPGVIFIHHGQGWDDDSKAFTRKFAHAGFAAICPNLHYREAPNASPEDAAAASKATGTTPDPQAVGDLEGAGKFLRSLPFTNGKVGIVGWCSGGRQSVLAGCKLDLDAVVDCWGGRVVAKPEELQPAQTEIVVDLIPSLSAPILGLFGAEDRNPSPAHVEKLRNALEENGKTFEFHSYEGAGHGFMATSRTTYRVEPTNDAWERILAFYDKYLAS
jgi:carboxymethylenebutenolidase